MSSLLAAVCGVGASQAGAMTLTLDGYTSSVQTVNVASSPVPNTPSAVGATGFNITDTTGSMGSFVAWCLDISHYLMSPGGSQDYAATTTPYSNSFGLSSTALSRVQSVFDANYGNGTLDLSIGDHAAAFQMALWEAAFEGAGAALSVSSGLFEASSQGSTALANTLLANAQNYTGEKRWNLTFLEVLGYGPGRDQKTGQNLVTVSAVPVPAAGLLLLSALIGGAALNRRRRTEA